MASVGRAVATFSANNGLVQKNLGRHAFRIAGVRRAALPAAALRGHALVLVFHRVTGETSSATGSFRRFPNLCYGGSSKRCWTRGNRRARRFARSACQFCGRPRFALTFDDDWITHHPTSVARPAGLRRHCHILP